MASLACEDGNLYRIHWRFRIRVGPRAGDEIEGSFYLGRCTKTAAKAKLREIDEWEQQVRTGRLIPGRSWQQIHDEWIRDQALRHTPQSLLRVKRVVALYLRWRGDRGLPSRTVDELACRADVTAWRDHRLDREAGRKTVANDLATLSALFAWCVRHKYLSENPLDLVTRPRFVARKEGIPLTREQAGQWLRSIAVRTGRGGSGLRTLEEVRRKRQLAVFLLNTGIRNGELCAVDVSDLHVDGQEQLLYIVGKGLKQRWVPLNRAALAAVRCHLRSRSNPSRGPLFVTQAGARYNERQLSNELVKTTGRKKDGARVNPHNLRHTFATWLAKSGVDLSVAQKVLGHENVNTTLKYYVHTGDHELAGSTARLRPTARPQQAGRPMPAEPVEPYRLIPFPERQVS